MEILGNLGKTRKYVGIIYGKTKRQVGIKEKEFWKRIDVLRNYGKGKKNQKKNNRMSRKKGKRLAKLDENRKQIEKVKKRVWEKKVRQ